MNGTAKEWFMGVFRTVVGTCLAAAIIGGWIALQEFRSFAVQFETIVESVKRIEDRVENIERVGILPEAKAGISNNRTRLDAHEKRIERNETDIRGLRTR